MECLNNQITKSIGSSETWEITNSTPSCNMNNFFSCINEGSCMQRKLYTEFDLLFDFISATVFGQGNIVLISVSFFFGGGGGGGGVGYEFSSSEFRIYFLFI